MPITYPTKPKRKMFSNISNVVYQILERLKPSVIVILFLLVTVSFRQLPTSFYAVFGLFVAGYFSERIIRIIQNNVRTNENTK